jgi:threonine dehydrogenase-like Zn-dependent dehydrogenase
MAQVAAGTVDVASLVTDVVAAGDVADAFARLDRGSARTLQVVLRFDAAPGGGAA